MIISADGIRSAFPSVISLVKKAPLLNKWKIIAFRQRKEGYEIQIRDVKLGEKDLFFKCEPDGEKIGLELYITGYSNEGAYDQAVYLLLDTIIGEYDMETQVGFIEMKPLSYNPSRNSLKPIIELPLIVDNHKKAH